MVAPKCIIVLCNADSEEGRYEGRCHCGAIIYGAEVEPGTVGLCHARPALRFVATGAAAVLSGLLRTETRARRTTSSRTNATRCAAVSGRKAIFGQSTQIHPV